MATYQSGGRTRATPNTVTAMSLSADRRRCPACGRGAALVRVVEDHGSGSHCRWTDKGCTYARWRDRETGHVSVQGLEQ